MCRQEPSARTIAQTTAISLKLMAIIHVVIREFTKGGKTFSAARRGTEKPPWVLVSLAVKVLQK